MDQLTRLLTLRMCSAVTEGATEHGKVTKFRVWKHMPTISRTALSTTN
jgi:hypothetical protein